MRKIVISLFIIFGFISIVQSQTVDSIKTEQSGDLIKIHYKILNSNSDQTFKVTILCSINGGLESVLKSLSGDFGDNVVGGRSDYMVLWDVLKDVDEIKTANFSVKAELIKGKFGSKSSTGQIRDRKVHVLLALDANARNFGPRLGYLGNWGFSAIYLTGSTPLEFFKNVAPIQGASVPTTIIGLDLTKRLVKKEKFQLHAMAGYSSGWKQGDRYKPSFQDYNRKFTGFNLGIVMDIGMLGLSTEIISLSDFLGNSTSYNLIIFGLGLRF
jgi:hypothetical protein